MIKIYLYCTTIFVFVNGLLLFLLIQSNLKLDETGYKLQHIHCIQDISLQDTEVQLYFVFPISFFSIIYFSPRPEFKPFIRCVVGPFLYIYTIYLLIIHITKSCILFT